VKILKKNFVRLVLAGAVMLMNAVRSDGETPPSLDAFARSADYVATETELFGAPALQFRVNDTVGNAVLMTIGIYLFWTLLRRLMRRLMTSCPLGSAYVPALHQGNLHSRRHLPILYT
jgi:hypothetical protein